jgi:hypothetical protein
MRRSTLGVLSAPLLVVFAVGTGCESAPGDRTTQSTVIGGAAGAAAGALIGGEGNRLLGALIGGALGAGGGYLIGAKTDWFEDDEDRADAAAREAVLDAERSPATVEDVRNALTADLNQDGFVTMDEVTAMERAGLSDDEMLDRLRATDQVFDLSPSQRERLLEAGVSRRVVAELPEINRDERDQILAGP